MCIRDSTAAVPDSQWKMLQDSARRSNIDDEEFIEELEQVTEAARNSKN